MEQEAKNYQGKHGLECPGSYPVDHQRTCVVAIRQVEQEWLAFHVQVKGEDVYVNYFAPDGTKQAHTSYHASGQQHIKVNGGYVCWRGGATGSWQPMKLPKAAPGSVVDRQTVAVIGWQIAGLSSARPPLPSGADMVVDASALPGSSIITFEISIVGPAAIERSQVLGFPVLQSHRFSGAVTVEIEAFLVHDAGSNP